jgi:DUF4097 and DUF4098 domain-containing protein YvlB
VDNHTLRTGDTMTEHHFETPKPVRLFTEVGKGSVKVEAIDTTETHVEIAGRDAEHVVVRQDGDQLTVAAPKQRGGFFGGDSRLDVVITLPTDSHVAIRTGSASIDVTGTVGGGQVRSGSGDVRIDTSGAPMVLETGSGDVHVAASRSDLKIKSGSGDVVLLDIAATSAVSTGSGDVKVGTNHGPVVVKTGSGDLEVREAESDVTLTTGSGDLVVGTARRGRLSVKAASGDVQVGVPAGTPVWTDIATVSGAVRSNLTGAGEPAEGADYVEVRAKTVSGDIVLTEI